MSRRADRLGRSLWGPDSALRQATRWLFAEREEINQEGLLAERTLRLAPRRARHDEPDAAAPAERADRYAGDAHR
jgi:hypothetical protein